MQGKVGETGPPPIRAVRSGRFLTLSHGLEHVVAGTAGTDSWMDRRRRGSRHRREERRPHRRGRLGGMSRLAAAELQFKKAPRRWQLVVGRQRDRHGRGRRLGLALRVRGGVRGPAVAAGQAATPTARRACRRGGPEGGPGARPRGTGGELARLAAGYDVRMRFRIEVGGSNPVPADLVGKLNQVLAEVAKDLGLG
jgi:hypothetical protein